VVSDDLNGRHDPCVKYYRVRRLTLGDFRCVTGVINISTP
jgi:hypothetical protein